MSKLKFHEKILAKGIATDALQKRLKALHAELAQLDQEAVDTASLSAVRRDLVSTSLLLHKDRGVKAYAACCLADLLRLYAPDAPYTEPELRDIFAFFFRQLSTGLKGPDSPYYNEYFHLLESLSTVKSVVLVCDLPNADELMLDVFRAAFGLVRHDLAKKIELFLADILIALIDECQSLSSDVLDCLMAQFVDKHPRMDQPAYRLAVQVCNATADKLQRHVCQYFTDVIVSHSRDDDLDHVRTAHDLVKQLNRSCPALLHNVVPQLEEELRVEDNQIRLMATQALGEMFADKGGADFVRKYPTTWNAWLDRNKDRASVVRIAFVDAAKAVLVNLPDARDNVEEALRQKMFDPDDKVRAAVCRLYARLDYETALHHVSQDQLRALAGRGIDKKHAVQVEALTAIARLYSLAHPEIETNDPSAIAHFAWIPQAILHMAAVSPEVKAAAEMVFAEYVLPLPLPSSAPPHTSSSSKEKEKEKEKEREKEKEKEKEGAVDEGAWTDRLLGLMRFLDERAVNILVGFSGVKAVRPTGFERYLQCCVAYNGGIVDENEEAVTEALNAVVKRVAAQFPDPPKTAEDLHAFARLNESRLYKLLRTCMDAQTDLRGLVRAWTEFLRRVEQSSATLLPTMKTLLRRASPHVVNASSIPTLLKRLQQKPPSNSSSLSSLSSLSSFNPSSASAFNPSSSDPHSQEHEHSHEHEKSDQVQVAEHAQTWLTAVSKHHPALYKAHVGELVKAISNAGADENNNNNSNNKSGNERSKNKSGDGNGKVVEVCLHALAAVSEWDEKLAPGDKRTVERLMRFATGSNERHAKFAARALAHSKNKRELCVRVVEAIADALPRAEADALVAHVAVLAQMAARAPEAFESKSDVVTAFLLKKVLMAPIPPPPEPDAMDTGADEEEEEWVSDAEASPALRAKVLALKTCRNRCLAHGAAENALEVVGPVLKMLISVLRHGGSLTADVQDGPKTKARMRLQAATSLLRLATVPAFANAIGPHFALVAITVQDSCYQVRVSFVDKLVGLLQARGLPDGYYVVPFLSVHDPEFDVINKSKAFITFALRNMPKPVRLATFEMTFIRLLHLLAHHPDFAVTEEALPDIAKYVEFYLDLVANPENVSLLYHLANKAKTVRDAESHTFSENLYAASELAQHLIQARAKSHGWSLESYPGKVRLPSDILRPLPSAEAASKVLKTVYLPENTVSWLAEQTKLKHADAKEKVKGERKAPAKRKSAGKTNGAAKRSQKKRKRRKLEEEEEEEDDESSASEESEPEESDDGGGGGGHASAREPAESSDEDEDGQQPAEERLGRGARTRAKARIKQQVKKTVKSKARAPSSDG